MKKDDFRRCLQCQSCTNGCPFAGIMDLPPHRLMRLLQMGLKEEVLRSASLWICVGCQACVSYCPMAVDIPGVIDELRHEALSAGVRPAEPDVVNFHQQVLSAIRRHGRANELEIILGYKLKKRDWLNDLGLGLKMLARRKLKLWPTRVRDLREVERIFGQIFPPKELGE